MTTQAQVIRDEAEAERVYQQGQKASAPSLRSRSSIKLQSLSEDEAAGTVAPPATPAVQGALLDPETKKVFEALILAIREQVVLKSEDTPDKPKPPGGVIGDKPGPG